MKESVKAVISRSGRLERDGRLLEARLLLRRVLNDARASVAVRVEAQFLLQKLAERIIVRSAMGQSVTRP